MTSVQINYDSVPRCPENAHDNIAYHLESLTIKEGLDGQALKLLEMGHRLGPLH